MDGHYAGAERIGHICGTPNILQLICVCVYTCGDFKHFSSQAFFAKFGLDVLQAVNIIGIIQSYLPLEN